MIKRWCEKRLAELMSVRRGVNLTGARQVGKTTLAQNTPIANPARYTLDDPEILHAAATDPKGFVKRTQGETIIIDEIQKAPELLDEIKIVIDRDNSKGQYLLTGSSNLRFAKSVRDSLAGRLGLLRLRSLSLGEINASPPDFLHTAFSQSFKRQYPDIDKRAVIKLAFEGGYPEPRTFSPRERKAWFKTYLDDLLEKDVRDVTQIRKIPLLKSAALWLLAHSSRFFTVNDLAAKSGVAKETAAGYLEALHALYLFDRIEPYAKNDYEMVGKRPKWIASDSALLPNILDWSEESVYLNQDQTGKLVETWVYQQLASIASATGEYEISHYRDNRQREIDFMVERSSDGALLGVEVKAGKVAAEDFKHLKWFAANVAKTPFTGIVLHSGQNLLHFGDNFLAVPLSSLS